MRSVWIVEVMEVYSTHYKFMRAYANSAAMLLDMQFASLLMDDGVHEWKDFETGHSYRGFGTIVIGGE